MAETSLSTHDRRAILTLLPRDRLAKLASRFKVEVEDRRSSASHIDAILKHDSIDFRALLGALTRDELRAACEALGVDSRAKTKPQFVEKLVAKKGALSGTGQTPMAPVAPLSGALKAELQRFVVETAGSAGRGSPGEFVARLLRCFGWPAGQPAGATMPALLTTAEGGKRTIREVPLLWSERRVIVEVLKPGEPIDAAWKDLLFRCLQVHPTPQYVLLTNREQLHLYDIARDHAAPRLAISLADLAKYSEAFPFLTVDWQPGDTPTIINVSKVSREVADLVAQLYRSLKKKNPKREPDVVKFVLQCIITMFAEDIGLLPQEYFTTLLYRGAQDRDVEQRLRELFRLMNTRDVPPPRVVPYFNGGLFSNPVTLSLDDEQLAVLTRAAESNWKYVDPHIFGSVFQGIMDDAERHASGAHYTAHDDIMRVVGPTIVEPWRERIREATTLNELLDVRAALLKYRVLDPACGSGNFLYVAFRELYRLDTELLARIRQFPSAQGQGKGRISWGVGIQTSNFFGIDINPFAVELAKVTLNIARKIAFDERCATAASLSGQIELDVDPSLPLDNLDKNIVCTDALFTEWPEVDAIVGNPPFLGTQKIRRELGVAYLQRLQEHFGVNGVVDMVCYWFRRSHDALPDGGRAGLVGTSGIRVGKAREASLDYISHNGGTITHAVSSRLWPGEAALNVAFG